MRTACLCLSASLLFSAFSLISTEVSASSSASSTKLSSVPTLKPVWKADNGENGLYSKQMPISNGLVFYIDSRQTLHAADFGTGKIKWSIPNAGSPDVITSNTVTFLDRSDRLVKVDLKTGKVQWRTSAVKSPNIMGAHVEMVGGLLLVLDQNGEGGISAFDPASGKRKWKNGEISMYAGGLEGLYKGKLVISSTVDNIHSQFFGLDLATGKKLWRIEGIYNSVGQEDGNIILREVTDQANRLSYGEKPFRGYMLRLALLDPTTGKIVKNEKYGLSQDARSSASPLAYMVGNKVYGVETSFSPARTTVVRYKRGEPASGESYAKYGDLVSDLQQGYFFFHKDGELTGLRIKDGSAVSYGKLPAPITVTGVHVSGNLAFAGLENGEYYIWDIQSGKALGVLPTKSDSFGEPFFQDGKLMIQTLSDLIVLDLPNEY